MEIAITLLAVASVILILAAIVTLLTPWVVAPIKALIRRDPGGAFVPHSQLVRSRAFGILYAGLALVFVIAEQPTLYRRNRDVVPATAAGSPGVAERVRLMVAPKIQSGEVLGIVVGVVDPSGTQVFGFGHRRLGAPPPDGQSVYEIGEISRTFTTLILTRMIERGQLGLHQPVRELLPDSVSVPTRADQPITLEELATDRSAMPARPPNLARSPLEWCPPYHNPYGGYTVKHLYRFLSGYDLDRPPGARIEESALGMGLLAHALTRSARSGFDTLVIREVCDRLGMPDTRVGVPRPQRDRFAQGYVVGRGSYRDWKILSPARPWTYGVLTGAGGLSSTANDLLSFLQAHLHLKSTDLAWAMDETRRPRYRGRGLDAVGMGWSVRLASPGSFQLVWCHGATGGTRSWIGMDETRRIGIVVLANSTKDVDQLGFDLLRTLP
jgi:CubicO group peptidase (beta-lactamase class C family)